MKRLQSLVVDWKMKGLDSARTEINELPNGHLELKIKHDIIKGVTPQMLVWWFTNFIELKNYNYKGNIIDIYRLWHPIDHIRVITSKQSNLGAGFIKGAKVKICEGLGKEIIVLKASVLRMDETGVTLHAKKGPFTVGRLTHNFTQKETGTLYESRLVIGTNAPVIGSLITALAKKKGFDAAARKAWLQHNIEEVGNFQFFLPQVYAEFIK
jgi:hypothetical protein